MEAGRLGATSGETPQRAGRPMEAGVCGHVGEIPQRAGGHTEAGRLGATSGEHPAAGQAHARGRGARFLWIVNFMAF